jgi:hypothetical protein
MLMVVHTENEIVYYYLEWCFQSLCIQKNHIKIKSKKCMEIVLSPFCQTFLMFHQFHLYCLLFYMSGKTPFKI